MFSVMVNAAMAEGASRDQNMHKEQCIGPGHWAGSRWFPVCFCGSVSQTDPSLQAGALMEEVHDEGKV